MQHEGGIRLLAMRVISRLRGLFRCRSLQHEGLVLQVVELTGQQDQAGAQCDQYRQRETIVQCSAVQCSAVPKASVGPRRRPKNEAGDSGETGDAGIPRFSRGKSLSRLRRGGGRQPTDWGSTGRRTRKAKSPQKCGLSACVYLAPRPGLEPGTYGLTVRRSTD